MTRATSKYRVPYLHEKVIEEHADMLLAEWAVDHPAVTNPPVPIEEMLEIGLRLSFEICDLQRQLGHPDVLGGIWFGARTIKVDQSLDPTNNPRRLGRYRFTLAHEVGHWRLHRQHLMDDPNTMWLFDDKDAPAFVCRSSSKPPEEWQADRFAANLLMPRRIVYAAWEAWRGSPTSVAVAELRSEPTAANATETELMDAFCRPLADQFKVSAEAMRIRLEEMELLARERVPSLFE